MRAIGDVPASEVVVDDIEDYLRSLSEEGLGPRSVNRHREVLRAIFNYGAAPSSGFELEDNPATKSELRRVDAPQPLEVFTVNEVERLCRGAADGVGRATPAWLAPRRPWTTSGRTTSSSGHSSASLATAACAAGNSLCCGGTTSAGAIGYSWCVARCRMALRFCPSPAAPATSHWPTKH